MAGRLPKSVQRITIVGDTGGQVVYKGKRKSKKRSRWLRPGETALRRAARAMQTGGDVYLKDHRKSNRKRKDGWVRDYPKNVLKAQRRAAKKVLRF